MATVAKRQLVISEKLTKELKELAQREHKSVPTLLEDLVTEHKRSRLKKQFKDIQAYWSRKADAKSIGTLGSLKGVLKGMSMENIREKPKNKQA